MAKVGQYRFLPVRPDWDTMPRPFTSYGLNEALGSRLNSLKNCAFKTASKNFVQLRLLNKYLIAPRRKAPGSPGLNLLTIKV
jgi:hypothetical protein